MTVFVKSVTSYFKRHGFKVSISEQIEELGNPYFQLMAERDITGPRGSVRIIEFHIILINDKNRITTYKEVKFFRNRYKKSIMPPYIYFVSKKGFDRKSLGYVRRYGGITLMWPRAAATNLR